MTTPDFAIPPALDASRQVFESSAGELSYYADETSAGRPLLLLHSLNAAPSAFEMKPLFEAYRGKRPVFAMDLPGYGFSQRDDRRLTVELYTAAIHAMWERMGGRPADVVALSLTSEFAARVAIDQPVDVATLCLITPTGFGLRSPPGGTTSDRIERFLDLPVLGRGLFALITSRPSLAFFLRKNFHGETREEMIDYAYATSHQRDAQYAPYQFLSGRLFTKNAVEVLYARLETPTLVVYDQDPNVSFERLPAWAKARDDRRLARIAPTRGLPHWEELDRTIQALESFWRVFSLD